MGCCMVKGEAAEEITDWAAKTERQQFPSKSLIAEEVDLGSETLLEFDPQSYRKLPVQIGNKQQQQQKAEYDGGSRPPITTAGNTAENTDDDMMMSNFGIGLEPGLDLRTIIRPRESRSSWQQTTTMEKTIDGGGGGGGGKSLLMIDSLHDENNDDSVIDDRTIQPDPISSQKSPTTTFRPSAACSSLDDDKTQLCTSHTSPAPAFAGAKNDNKSILSSPYHPFPALHYPPAEKLSSEQLLSLGDPDECGGGSSNVAFIEEQAAHFRHTPSGKGKAQKLAAEFKRKGFGPQLSGNAPSEKNSKESAVTQKSTTSTLKNRILKSFSGMSLHRKSAADLVETAVTQKSVTQLGNHRFSAFIINPRNSVVFNGPFDRVQISDIQIHNQGTKLIGWICKSNMPRKFRLEKGKGVLKPAETAILPLKCLPFDPQQQSKWRLEKLFFRWVEVPKEVIEGRDESSELAFDMTWFQRDDAMIYRKNLFAEYKEEQEACHPADAPVESPGKQLSGAILSPLHA